MINIVKILRRNLFTCICHPWCALSWSGGTLQYPAMALQINLQRTTGLQPHSQLVHRTWAFTLRAPQEANSSDTRTPYLQETNRPYYSSYYTEARAGGCTQAFYCSRRLSSRHVTSSKRQKSDRRPYNRIYWWASSHHNRPSQTALFAQILAPELLAL